MQEMDVSGTIGALWVFPIKSCAGISVQSAMLLPTGLQWDRTWMVVDTQGMFITQRDVAHMALIQPQIDAQTDSLWVSFPALKSLCLPLHRSADEGGLQISVQVWESRIPAWDMGDEAARWFSTALQRQCRLVRFDGAQQRLSSMKWTTGIAAPNHFSDGYPLLLTTRLAIEALNRKLQVQGCEPVDILRFRSNIVLDGFFEHEEDYIDSLWVQAPEPVEIRLGKPCSRCPIPNIDPRTAHSSPEVMDILFQYRQDSRLGGAVTFGMNAVVAQGAGQSLSVGQAVVGQFKFE